MCTPNNDIQSRILKSLRIYLLFLILLPSFSLGQPYSVVYFFDDFEDGNADGWDLQPGWQVENDNGNFVLSGAGSKYGYASRGDAYTWKNYSIKMKFKLFLTSNIAEDLIINYRMDNNFNSYKIYINRNMIWLKKWIYPIVDVEFATANISINYEEWHSIEIMGQSGNLKIVLDDVTVMEYTDSDPIRYGKIAIGFPPNGQVDVDNVLVVGDTLPIPPTGYSWVKLGGPRGGLGYDVQFHPNDPNIIFVTDVFVGIHKTENGGLTWIPKNKGIISQLGIIEEAPPIFSLTIDTNNPNIIWAGVQSMRGIVKSTDGGESWVAMMNGIPEFQNMEFRSFTIEPNNSDIIYCGGNYTPDLADPYKVNGFIFKTVDGGDNWKQILECGALVRWIRIDPTNTDIIFASTGLFDRRAVKQEGILKSTNGGKNWFNINDGLTCLAVNGLVMHPSDPKVLYAVAGQGLEFVTLPTDSYGYIFKTVNGGNHWVQLIDNNEKFGPFTTIAISSSNPNILYASGRRSMLKSTDVGLSWVEHSNAPLDELAGWPIGMAIHPKNSNIVYIDAYAGGVFMTNDGGETWINSSKGYSGAQCWDLEIDRKNPSHIFVGHALGTYKSVNGGDTWEGTANMGYYNSEALGVDLEGHRSISINPNNTKEILVGNVMRGHILKSNNGGITWKKVLQDLTVTVPVKLLEDRISIYRILRARTNPKVYIKT